MFHPAMLDMPAQKSLSDSSRYSLEKVSFLPLSAPTNAAASLTHVLYSDSRRSPAVRVLPARNRVEG
jgi:hypothetical protein